MSEPFQLARCYERDPKSKKTKSMQVRFKTDLEFLQMLIGKFADDEDPGLCSGKPPCRHGGRAGQGVHVGGRQLWKVRDFSLLNKQRVGG